MMTDRGGRVRMVVLSNGHEFGRFLLGRLASHGMRDVTAVLSTPPLFPPLSGGGLIARRLGRWGLEWLRFVRAWWRYRAAGTRPIIGGALRGTRLPRVLARLAPDYILLGGIGILPQAVLDTASRAVLNAHPALLPWVRGTGVVGGALRRGVPVGVTCHLVSAGVDLGDIIERRLLVVDGSESLPELERRADDLAIEMLVDAAARCSRHGMPHAATQHARYPLCRWLSPAERAEVEGRVAGGLAKALFDRWASRSDATRGYRLFDDELQDLTA